MRLQLSQKAKKLVHAGMVSLISTATSIGAQLEAGSLNVTRAVVVGLVIGALARLAGSVIAAMATTDA